MKFVKLMLAVAAIGLLHFTSPAQSFLTNGLVAYYPFNGNATDASGNGNNATAVQAAPSADRFGNPNQAYSFNGTNSYIGFSNAPMSQIDNWSLVAWVNPTTFSQTGIAMSLGYDNGVYGDGFALGINGSQLLAMFGGLGYINNGFTLPATNQWYQIVMLRDAGVTRLYVNGVFAGGGDTTAPQTPTAFRIGSNIGVRFFNGAIDDVRLYNRALSSNEVAQLYGYETVPPQNFLTNGLMAYYPFNGNAHDATGNGNDGTAINGVSYIPSPLGAAASFNGNSQYISLPNTISNYQDLSVTFWIKTSDFNPNGFPYGEFLISRDIFGFASDWNICLGQGRKIQFLTDADALTTPQDIASNDWVQVSCVADSVNQVKKLFVNGQVVTSASWSPNPFANNTVPIFIGASTADTGAHAFFTGGMAAIRIYNRALTTNEVQAIYAMENANECTPPPTGLVGWWPAEGNASDIVGGDNGALQGGATFASGEVEQGFRLDGTNGYVQIPDSAALKPANVTVEAWVWLDPNLPANRGGEQIVFKKNTSTAWFEGYSLLKGTFDNGDGTFTDRFQFCVSRSGNQVPINSQTIAQRGVWYHVAATYDGNQSKLYVNGVLEASATPGFALDYDTTPVFIGTSGTWVPYLSMFGGIIDEVSIYNRALATNEIAAIYMAGSAGKCAPTQDCVAYPNFNSTNGLSLTGSTTVTNGVLRLTPAASGQTGDAWLATKEPCAGGFDTTFHFSISQLGNDLGNESGGDGFTFAVQNSGPTNLSWAMGDTNQFVAVFFNTFWNWPGCACPDLSGNSVGIVVNQSYLAQADLNPLGIDMSDGAPHLAHVNFNGTGLTVWVDGVMVLTNVPLAGLLPGVDESGKGWVGFTAGTGNAFENHDIIDWSFCPGSNTSNGSPVILSFSPATNLNVVAGSTVNFAVSAQGMAPLNYQWRFNNTNLTGATDSSLTLSNVQPAQAGIYSVVVSNLAGFAVSSNVLLTVVSPAPPIILSQTPNQIVLLGGTATFSVNVSGDAPLIYFWQRNGVPVPGATNASYSLLNAQLLDSGSTFRCLVTNAYGSASSTNVTLKVLDSVANDLCSGAVIIASASYTNAQSTLKATSFGDPVPDCVDDFGHGVWYQFTAPVAGRLIVDTFGSDFDTGLAVYTGSCDSLTEVACNDDTGGVTSQVIIPTAAGLTYSILAGGYDSDAGNLVLHLTHQTPPVFVIQPTNQWAVVGSNVTFTAVLNGTPPLSYQWFLDGNPLSDGAHFNGSASPSLTISNVTTVDAVGSYSVTVTNFLGSATSAAANLDMLSITTQPVGRSVPPGLPTTFTATASTSLTPAYQWQLNGTNISGATSASYTIPAIGTNDLGFYRLLATYPVGVAVSTNAQLTFGSVAAWGRNASGECLPPPGLTNVFAVAGAFGASFAVRTDGSIAAWGSGAQTNIPASASNVVAIATSGILNYALMSDGRVVSWGGISAPALSNIVSLAVGSGFGYALRTEGTLTNWGSTPWGSNPALNFPVGLNHVTAIAAGNNNAIAVKNDGTIVMAGIGAVTNVPAGLTNVVSVAVGNTYDMALKADGKVVAWGTGTATNLPAGMTNIVAISAGNYPNENFGVAIRSNGKVLAWGDNGSGEINAPAALTNLFSIAGAAAAYHGLALVNDGSPVILRQPVGLTSFTGRDVTLQGSAAGAQPLSYQWLFNGLNIPGATNASLFLSNVQPGDAGGYQLFVSNSINTALVALGRTADGCQQ